MIKLKTLCGKIAMPEEVTEKVIAATENMDFSLLKKSVEKFRSRESRMDGIKELRTKLGEDPLGFKMLAYMLTAAGFTYDQYTEKQIDEKIFFDTFACFSRFVKEHRVSYGCYGFDREWWTPRQVAMQLFRIGELEYEMIEKDGKNQISIHIPSDAKLTRENCWTSLQNAFAFFRKYYPEYYNVNYICNSWLLSPNLKQVLDEHSNILMFQSAFQVTKFNPDDVEFMGWVFKNPAIPVEELPEKTSLQRNLKAYLKSGGKIGCAFGILKDHAFE